MNRRDFLRNTLYALVATTVPLPAQPLADAYPAERAYSLRPLSSTYSGPLARVSLWDHDGLLLASVDITSTHDVDALLDDYPRAWDATVSTLYDQTGNGSDLVVAS